MRLRLFEFACYAVETKTGQIDVCGIMNRAEIQRKPDAPADAPKTVVLPPFFLVAIVEASIGDGLQHTAALRMVDADGDPASEMIPLGQFSFVLNQVGRPMRFQAVINLNSFAVPQPGEYSFEFYVDGRCLGDTVLYVDDVTDRP